MASDARPAIPDDAQRQLGDVVRQAGSVHAVDFPRSIQSWITPKARKGGASAIEGRGVHAVEPIEPGEVVAIKGGHIIDGNAQAALPAEIKNSSFQIGEDHFLAALAPSEYMDVMMLVNHSCEPNVGMGGNVLLVSMRAIASGEELTIDYCLFVGDPAFSMACHCSRPSCRTVITGTDWSRPDLQARYRGWFSWYLARRIAPG